MLVRRCESVTEVFHKQYKRRKRDRPEAKACVTSPRVDARQFEYCRDNFVAVNLYDHEMVDLRFELKDQLTREEWAAVFSESPP